MSQLRAAISVNMIVGSLGRERNAGARYRVRRSWIIRGSWCVHGPVYDIGRLREVQCRGSSLYDAPGQGPNATAKAKRPRVHWMRASIAASPVRGTRGGIRDGSAPVYRYGSASSKLCSTVSWAVPDASARCATPIQCTFRLREDPVQWAVAS